MRTLRNFLTALLHPAVKTGFCGLMWLIYATFYQTGAAYGLEVHGLEFPPYIMTEKNGDAKGIIVDMVRELAVRLDEPVQFTITNWARAYRVVTRHESDALIPTMKIKERLKFLHYPETPLLYLNFYLIRHKDSPHKFSGELKDLTGYKVGRIRGAKVAPSFDQALANGLFTVKERSNTKLLVKGLLYKRLDFIALDWRVARWEELAMTNQHNIQVVEPPLGKVPVYLALSKERNTRDKVVKISNELLKMQNDNVLERLENKYLTKPRQ